jgi:hypothetical protein
LSARLLGLGGAGHVCGNGPQQSDQVTGNGYHDLGGVFAARYAFSRALAQSPLGLPADVLDGFGWCGESPLPVSPHGGGLLISPSAFHQRPPGMGVPRVGDRPLPASLSTGRCGRHAAQARHQLSGRLNAREVAEFGQGRDRHGALPPPQGLEGRDDRRPPPSGDLRVECLLQTL